MRLFLIILLALFATCLHAADAPPGLPDPGSYQVLGWIVFIIVGLAAGFNQILGIVRHYRSDPPAHDRFASKDELRALEQRHAEELANLAARINGMDKASKESREKIYLGLKELAETQSTANASQAAIQATLLATTQHLCRLETKIDRTNERLADNHA